MNELEKKRKELQIIKAQSAKAELEFKILERMDDIERMKAHIKLQDETISNLKKELGE